MRAGLIQQAIHNGVAPFALCRIVSSHIRLSHKRGDHIQDSIGAVFHSLPRRTATAYRDSVGPNAGTLPVSAHGTANAILAHAMQASIADLSQPRREEEASRTGTAKVTEVN